jgi:hypothetical protein
MYKRILYLFLGLTVVAACKKVEVNPDMVTTPVFVQDFLVDSLTYRLYGGQDSVIYMFSSILEDDYQTRVSALAAETCPEADCPGSLRFEFRNYAFIDSSVSIRFIGTTYQDLERTRLDLETSSKFVQILLDDAFVYEGPPQDSGFVIDLQAKPATFSAILQGDSFGEESRFTTTIYPGNQDAPLIYPFVNIVATKDSLGYLLTAKTSGLSGQTYIWNTGSTSETALADSTLTYTVTVTSMQGFTASASVKGLNPGYIPNETDIFSYTSKTLPPAVGSVSIVWTDEAGVQWRSDLSQQPSDASFYILEEEPYLNNEKGQKTRKIRVKYDCVVFADLPVPSKRIRGEGTLAIVVP